MSSAKKESLFRTSETGRVGFTGSGKGMVIKKKINKKESLFRTYETVRVGFTGSDEVVIVYKPNPNLGVKQTLFWANKPNPNLGDRGLKAVARAWQCQFFCWIHQDFLLSFFFALFRLMPTNESILMLCASHFFFFLFRLQVDANERVNPHAVRKSGERLFFYSTRLLFYYIFFSPNMRKV